MVLRIFFTKFWWFEPILDFGIDNLTPKSLNLDKFWSTKSKILISQILWVLGGQDHNSKKNITNCNWSQEERARMMRFKHFLYKILVMRANFGDFGDFDIDFKILESRVTVVTPYWDNFFKILTFEFWWNRKVMINHRGGILIFGQILSKLKILDFRDR